MQKLNIVYCAVLQCLQYVAVLVEVSAMLDSKVATAQLNSEYCSVHSITGALTPTHLITQ